MVSPVVESPALPQAWRAVARRLQCSAVMSALTDEELLQAAGLGDRAAFQALVSRYSEELLGFFRRPRPHVKSLQGLTDLYVRLGPC